MSDFDESVALTPLCTNCRKCMCHFYSKPRYITSICEEFGKIEIDTFSSMGCKEFVSIFKDEDNEVAG